MTALNFTITPERAWLSQDHGLAQESDALPETIEKVHVCHERGMVVGASGSFLHAMLWRARLPTLPRGDVTEIADAVPEALRQVIELPVAADVADLIVIHAGWSKSEGRVVAYLYQRANDFEPMRVDQGHTYMPAELSNDAPGYPRLYELWPHAIAGRSVRDFHAALLENQRYSQSAGRLKPGAKLSASFSIATIDHAGARLEMVS